MVFVRRIKKKSGVYLAEVESYRENGKVKQRVVKYLGKDVDGRIVRKVSSKDISVKNVKRSLDVLSVDKVAGELGLKGIGDRAFLALVYSQLLENRSVNKLEAWMKFTEIPERLGLKDIRTVDLYNALTGVSDGDFLKIESDLAGFFRNYEGNKNTAIIDVTDTYFEGKGSGIKPCKGKEGKVRPLTQFALAVTMENGFPLFYRQYGGNLSDIQIFKDMVLRLRQKGLNAVVVDRGMTSEESLKMVLGLEMQAIAGLKKNSRLVTDYIKNTPREEIFSLKNRCKLKNTSVYIKTHEYKEGKLIVVYNPALELLKKEHAFEKGIEKEKAYGYSLIYHNTEFESKEVVKKYYEKDTVERAFKQLKGILNLRPVRVWLKEHVQGHFKICYLAYAILSFMNFKLKKTGISANEALDSLKQGYKVKLRDNINKHEWDLYVPLEPNQKKILKTLGVVYKNT